VAVSLEVADQSCEPFERVASVGGCFQTDELKAQGGSTLFLGFTMPQQRIKHERRFARSGGENATVDYVHLNIARMGNLDAHTPG